MEEKKTEIKDNRIGNITIILKPTEACNLNCEYCYAKKFREIYGKEKITDEIVDKILTLTENYAKHITLLWHGGEPTLMGVDWYYHIQDVVKKHTKAKIEQSMQTNGTLLNAEWAKMARETNISIGASFDVFDQNIRIGNTNYDVEKNLKEFNKENENTPYRLGTITVINKESYGKLIDIYEYFKKNFSHSPAFNFIFNTQDEQDAYLLADYKEFSDKLTEFAKYLIYDTSENATGERTIINTLKIIIGSRDIVCTNIDCTHHWIGLCCNGDIYPCDQPHYKCGNISEFNSMEEVYNSPNFLKYMEDKDTRYNNYCSKCSYYEYCQGGCNSNHIAATGTNTKVDHDYCGLFKSKFYNIYMLMRDVDIYSGINPAILRVLIMQPGFTLLEIKDIMEKNNIYFDFNENLTIGNLLSSKEFKIFRLFNPFQGKKINGHINYCTYGNIYLDTSNMDKIKENRLKNITTAFNREKENIIKILNGEM